MASIEYLPHQFRVLEEHDELSDKLELLSEFNKNNPLYDSLPPLEKERLMRQEDYMRAYLQVLTQRIHYFQREAFKKQTQHSDIVQYPRSEVFCNASVERAFHLWLEENSSK